MSRKNRGPKAFASPGDKPADAPETASTAGAPTDQVEKQRQADANKGGATEAKDQVEKQREADAQKGNVDGQATQAGQAGADDSAASGQRDPDGGAAAAADANAPADSAGASAAVKPEPDIAAEVDAAIDAAGTPPLSIDIRAAWGAHEAIVDTLFALELQNDEFDQVFKAIGWPDREVAEEAASFVLANREAPAAAIQIHLAMRGMGQKRQLSDVEAMLWDIFRTVLLRIFDLLTARAAAAAPPAEKPAPGGMGGDQSFLPQPGAFDAAGFAPRR